MLSVRYEFKYLLNFPTYYALSEIISRVLPRDAHVKKKSYPILSLYYDSPEREYFYQKINGEQRHVKIRARVYDKILASDSKIFLEEKIKIGDRQSKIRKIISYEELFRENALNHMDHQDFLRENNTLKLNPSCYVYYEREPYEGIIDDKKLRITFDSQMRSFKFGQKLEQAKIILNEQNDKKILMEIKFENQELPIFLKGLLSQFSLRRHYFSKYSTGLELQII